MTLLYIFRPIISVEPLVSLSVSKRSQSSFIGKSSRVCVCLSGYDRRIIKVTASLSPFAYVPRFICSKCYERHASELRNSFMTFKYVFMIVLGYLNEIGNVNVTLKMNHVNVGEFQISDDVCY